jgi:hypothetical protein
MPAQPTLTRPVRDDATPKSQARTTEERFLLRVDVCIAKMSAFGKLAPEHRRTILRLGLGRFVAQNVPVFGEQTPYRCSLSSVIGRSRTRFPVAW